MSAKDRFLLCLGPVLALALAGVLLGSSDAYWDFAASFPAGEPMHVEGLLHQVQPGGADIAILGSSVALVDVDEQILDQSLEPLHTRSLNLAVTGAPACSTAMMMPDVIRLAPKVVLLVLSHHDLRSNRATTWARVYDPRVAVRLFDVRSFFTDRSFHLNGILAWSSLVCRHRDGWRKWFLEYRRQKSPTHLRDLPRLEGPRMEQALQDVLAREQVLKIDGTGPNFEAIRYMATVLKEAGIHFVVSPAPVNPVVRRGYYDPGMARLLLQMERDLGFVRLRGGDLGTYESEEFRDTYHLGKDAQRRYTQAVAEALRPLLTGTSDAVQ